MVKAKRALACAAAFALLIASALLGIPARAENAVYSAVLEDLDDCLSESEEAELLNIMRNAAYNVQCDIGIVITADLMGMTDERYADAFGFENFANGSWVVLMLLNSHGNPAYTSFEDIFAKHNGGYDKFNAYSGSILNAFYNGFDKSGGDNFYEGVRSFCGALERYGSENGGAGRVIENAIYYANEHFAQIFFATVFAVTITLIAVSSTVAGYKKKSALSAEAYLDKNRTKITRQVDAFVREYTTSYTVSSSSHGGRHGGGHSGGGGHHSSSHGRHR